MGLLERPFLLPQKATYGSKAEDGTMAFWKRLGWTKADDEIRGQYASVGEHDDPASKEGEGLSSLQEQHRALLESHRKLKLWLRGVCVIGGLVIVVLVTAMHYARRGSTASRVLTPVPESMDEPFHLSNRKSGTNTTQCLEC